MTTIVRNHWSVYEASEPNMNADSVKIMRVHDALPKTERHLVHEFGIVIVTRLMEAGYRGHALQQQLQLWRCNRQEQWLRG